VRDLLVEPGSNAQLANRDTGDKLGLDKVEAAEQLVALTDRLRVLQQRLWAEHERALLLVLQGPDASGKDGTIRRVSAGLNPQGCVVQSFKAPTADELDHDFLWRVHHVLPPRGEIGIFNRSHYEDVVTTRVLGLIDDDTRERRYEEINAFERMLHNEGTEIVKVFLNLGRGEQRKRLQARLDDPEKRWKFRPEDLEARAEWDTYQKLYESAIEATSTKRAPWYVVPADHKWVSGLAVAQVLVDALEAMDPRPPKPAKDLDNVVVE
jgi:PPK2 family polyphosphate:nucleotide phosphotransferase